MPAPGQEAAGSVCGDPPYHGGFVVRGPSIVYAGMPGGRDPGGRDTSTRLPRAGAPEPDAMSDGSGGPGSPRAKRRRRRGGQGDGQGAPAIETSPQADRRPLSAEAALAREAWAVRAWRRMLREPSLGLSTGYVLVSMIGLWANYWFYRQFGLPILEYMQASDYLVAGLRDPGYALVLALSVTISWLVSWPEMYRKQHPRRVRELQRRWWGRFVFPQSDWFRWTLLRLKPETGIAIVVFMGMALSTCSYVIAKANRIRDEGAGHAVRVTLAGAAAPLPGQARLLGASSAYVFLWWPGARRAEAVPIEGVGRLQALPRSRKRDAAPAKAPLPATAPAATAPAS